MFPVALIGYGAIGRVVVASLDLIEGVRLTHVLVRKDHKAAVEQALGGRAKVISDLGGLDPKPALIVECASHRAVMEFGPEVLRRGLDFAVVSTGALADPAVEQALADAARVGNARLHLVSGAIGAMDALAAARLAGLTRVLYLSRKPPLAWSGTPAEQRFDLGKIATPTVLYEGTARDAARLYPKNANVAATVALAGLGFEGTMVRLTADPTVAGNIHHIEAEGRFGHMTFEIAGEPLPDNPKTSMLTAYSVVRAIRDRAALMPF